MNKTIIIALFGKSGAGKDTIQKELLKYMNNSKGIISNTTRPPREYERNGIDYHFLSISNFIKKITKKEMLEATYFNNWFYGTSIDSLNKNKINIGVFNPQGISELLKDKRILVIPIYIKVDDKERLLRQLKREKNPNCAEICRRFFTDEEDFKQENLDFNFYSFDNNNSGLEKSQILNLINSILEELKSKNN